MKTIVSVILFVGLVHAQSFDEWFDQLIEKQRVAKNGQGAERQRESPSADPRSTSLVDQSAATDFISLAANLIPVSPGISRFVSVSPSAMSRETNASGSGTITATLYALIATLNKVRPTDPEFYKAHVDTRSLSFTIGTAASRMETDNTDKPATVFGAKYLIINHRELYTKDNLRRIDDVQKNVTNFAVVSARMKDRIQGMMFEALHPEGVKPDGTYDQAVFSQFLLSAFSSAEFPKTLKQMPGSAVSRIEDYIRASGGPYVLLKTKLDQTYDEISKAGQLSIAYTANVRSELGNNYHRAEIIYDYGVSERILWTFNGSVDYTDRKSGIDSRGGRFATEFQGDLTRGGAGFGRLPMRLSFSGEGKWMVKQKPQYTVQTKLSTPITPGLELAVVYRYANRIEQINQTASEVRLGLSFDPMRLTAALK